MVEKNYPEGWMEDKLSEFLEMVHGNTHYVFTRHFEEYQILSEIHNIFEEISNNFLKFDEFKEALSAFFFTMARTSFLGAVRLGTGGQLFEPYPVLRQCIESSIYGYYCLRLQRVNATLYLYSKKMECRKWPTAHE